jgi:hypothetical protein
MLWSFKNFDAHKQENVLYQICGVLCEFTIEWNVDCYNVKISKLRLEHEGDRWFNDVGKIIIVCFEDHTNKQVYAMCQIALFIGITAAGTYCYHWALVGTVAL